MSIRLTHRRMSTWGSGHEHIEYLWYTVDGTGQSGVMNRDQWVQYIDKKPGSVYCPDQFGGRPANVQVNSNGFVRFPKTVADRRWTNNLLALPLG